MPSAYKPRMLCSRLVRDSCWPKASTSSSPRESVSAFRAISWRRSELAPSRCATSCATSGCTLRDERAEGAAEAAPMPCAREPSASQGASSYMSWCEGTRMPDLSGR